MVARWWSFRAPATISEAEARIVSRSNFIYSEAAYATALDASIGAERKGPHTPHEAPGADYDKDKDYQLERAFDVLRAGGELTQLAAAPEGIVVTAPGTAMAAVEDAGDNLPEPRLPSDPVRPATPGN